MKSILIDTLEKNHGLRLCHRELCSYTLEDERGYYLAVLLTKSSDPHAGVELFIDGPHPKTNGTLLYFNGIRRNNMRKGLLNSDFGPHLSQYNVDELNFGKIVAKLTLDILDDDGEWHYTREAWETEHGDLICIS
jgi:hypothetical protein